MIGTFTHSVLITTYLQTYKDDRFNGSSNDRIAWVVSLIAEASRQ